MVVVLATILMTACLRQTTCLLYQNLDEQIIRYMEWILCPTVAICTFDTLSNEQEQCPIFCEQRNI